MRCIEGLLFIFLSNVHYRFKEIDHRIQKDLLPIFILEVLKPTQGSERK